MSKRFNVNSLKQAQKDVTKKLKHDLIPVVYGSFVNIYKDCKNADELFADVMDEIREWPTTYPEMLDAEIDEIKETIPKIENTLKLLITMKVMIISGVKYHECPEIVDFKPPSLKKFVFKLYLECGQIFSSSPELLDTTNESRSVRFNNKRNAALEINTAIDNALDSVMPTNELVDKYLEKQLLSEEEEQEQPIKEEESMELSTEDFDQDNNAEIKQVTVSEEEKQDDLLNGIEDVELA